MEYGFACGRRVFGVWLDFGPVTFGFGASDIRNHLPSPAFYLKKKRLEVHCVLLSGVRAFFVTDSVVLSDEKSFLYSD